MLKVSSTILTSEVSKKPEINAAVSEVERLLAPDVVHIRFELAPDWSGDPSIFFRVLLSDEVTEARLHHVTRQVRNCLDDRLDFIGMGLFVYHNFRSVSEQAVLREEAWA
jgi:hypothetical protein